MTNLPADLRPWGAFLSQFPSDLLAHVGGHVLRLNAAMGPLRLADQQGGGEPAGYGGISRRGPFERLLLSEWALALELPEEFLRRAAMKEQSFLQQELRRPRARARCVALFDAGTSQLGAPRLAHLALLVVLARRAEAAGLQLEWGVLQESAEGAVRCGFTPQDARALLEARTDREPHAGDLLRWRAALGDLNGGEGWLIGGAHAQRLEGADVLWRVQVDDPSRDSPRALRVSLRAPGRRAREVELPLPPDAARIRLVRDPFSVAAPEVKPAEGTHEVCGRSFCFGALRRLVFVSTEGKVVAAHVPGSPRAPAGTPRAIQIPADERLVAAGYRRSGGLLALTAVGSEVWIRGAEFAGSMGLLIRRPLALFKGAALDSGEPLRTAWLDGSAARGVVFFIDEHDHLFSLDLAASQMQFVSRGALALSLRPRGPAYVAEVNPSPGETHELRSARPPFSRLHLDVDRRPHAFFFGYGKGAYTDWGPFAFASNAGGWHVHRDGAFLDLRPYHGTSVVGMVALAATGGAALVVLEADRQTFSILGRQQSKKLFRASAEVLHVVVGDQDPLLACLTRAGEVVVVCLRTGNILMRLPARVKP